MMKLICLGLLVALTLQISTRAHQTENPLSGKSFVIDSSSNKEVDLSGITLHFKDYAMYFRGCNYNNGGYHIENDNAIRVTDFISTRMYCVNDKDDYVRSLLQRSVKFELDSEQSLKFFDTD
jgi:heat shock protein HslJ